MIRCWRWGLSVGVLLLGVQALTAQQMGRPPLVSGYQPPVSPYLNVLQGSPLGAATGYYTLTRPSFVVGAQLSRLAGGVEELQARPGAVRNTEAQGLLPGFHTGHPVGFFRLEPYFGGGTGTGTNLPGSLGGLRR